MERSSRNAIVFGVILSWTLFPLICVLVAATISALCGGSINEGLPTPCFVFGTDIGKPLFILGVMGWLSIVTLPTGAIGFLIYFAFLMIERTVAAKRRGPAR